MVAFKLVKGVGAALSNLRDLYLWFVLGFIISVVPPVLNSLGFVLNEWEGSRIKRSVLCAMVKILCVFKSLGPKLAKGFEYIGICDSCTGKCWRFTFIGLAVVISEFKCLIKIQLESRVLKNFD